MSIRNQHIELITRVAEALGDLNDQVVYVGGAVVSLYVTDPAAPDVRPTDDVDITLEITSLFKLEALREELNRKGFTQSPDDNVMCRFRYEGIKVDVMATQEVGWAPANPWFKPGFDHLENRTVGGFKLRVLSLPYFLASKLTAFRSRAKDPRTSHDLEDVIYLLDNRDDLTEEIRSAPDDVKKFLKEEFGNMLGDELIREAMVANLEYEIQTERFAMIEEKLTEVIDAK
jgi:predicted nucleotidyltransferase